MLAVETHRTTLNWGRFHVCLAHKKLVDKQHIDCCNLLATIDDKKPTHYNHALE